MENLECKNCGKKLVYTPEFIYENDIVECSNCKEVFKFVKKNLIKKTETSENLKDIIIIFIIRLFIAVGVSILYFLIKDYETYKNEIIIFSLINIAPFIINFFLYYILFGKLINYKVLIQDKFVATKRFWLVLTELILIILLNLIFFIIY